MIRRVQDAAPICRREKEMYLTVYDNPVTQFKEVYANGGYIGCCECCHNVLSFRPVWNPSVRIMAVGVSELRYKILKLYDFDENKILNLAIDCEDSMKGGSNF